MKGRLWVSPRVGQSCLILLGKQGTARGFQRKCRLRLPRVGVSHQFKNHLSTYFAVIGVMFLANIVGGWWWGGGFFFFWVTLIWGVVLAVQASRLFGSHLGREWEDRMVDHIMARRRGACNPYQSPYASGPIVTPPPSSSPGVPDVPAV